MNIIMQIDGVLNDKETTKKLENRKANDIKDKFSPKSAELLKKLVKETDANVYVWKHGDHKWNIIKTRLLTQCEIKATFIESLDLLMTMYDENDTVILGIGKESDKKGYIDCRSGLDNKDGFKYKHYVKAIHMLLGDDYIIEE